MTEFLDFVHRPLSFRTLKNIKKVGIYLYETVNKRKSTICLTVHPNHREDVAFHSAKSSVCFVRCCYWGSSVPRGERGLNAMGYFCKKCVAMSIKCFVNKMDHDRTLLILGTLKTNFLCRIISNCFPGRFEVGGLGYHTLLTLILLITFIANCPLSNVDLEVNKQSRRKYWFRCVEAESGKLSFCVHVVLQRWRTRWARSEITSLSALGVLYVYNTAPNLHVTDFICTFV
jgi:hypothetical protein